MPFEHLNREGRRIAANIAAKEALKRPARLTKIPPEEWPKSYEEELQQVWHSNRFLVQQFAAKAVLNGLIAVECKRLSVCRVTLGANGRWDANITWDELYEIKSELGFGDWYAIEIYPRERDLVNVANMRHLWLMPEPLEIGWFKS